MIKKSMEHKLEIYTNNYLGFNKFLRCHYDIHVGEIHGGFASYLIDVLGVNKKVTTFRDLMKYLGDSDISKEEMQGYYFLFKL